MWSKWSTNTRMLAVLIAALAVWGAILALGACLGGIGSPDNLRRSVDIRRGGITLACTAGFLLGWLGLLALRRRRS